MRCSSSLSEARPIRTSLVPQDESRQELVKNWSHFSRFFRPAVRNRCVGRRLCQEKMCGFASVLSGPLPEIHLLRSRERGDVGNCRTTSQEPVYGLTETSAGVAPAVPVLWDVDRTLPGSRVLPQFLNRQLRCQTGLTLAEPVAHSPPTVAESQCSECILIVGRVARADFRAIWPHSSRATGPPVLSDVHRSWQSLNAESLRFNLARSDGKPVHTGTASGTQSAEPGQRGPGHLHRQMWLIGSTRGVAGPGLTRMDTFWGSPSAVLADRLGVHGSQVSRDERNEYHGVTVDRANRVLAALGVDLRSEVVLLGMDETATVPSRSSV